MPNKDERHSMWHIPFPEYPNVIAIFEDMATGPIRSKMHSHSWAEINVVLEGYGIWYTQDGVFEVGEGDALLLMPETPHHAKWPAGVTHKTGTLNFFVGQTQQSLFNFHAHGGIKPGPPQVEVCEWLWEALARRPYHHLKWTGFGEWWSRLYAEGEAAAGPYRALRVESAMLETLSRFADPAFGHAKWLHFNRRGVERALRYISENITAGPITVAELADVAGMSRSKFASLFHNTLGIPPHTYTTALRIWMAQSALAGSRSPASIISGSLGFSSPQHFSRTFKRVTGMSPQEYRNRWAAPWTKKEK